MKVQLVTALLTGLLATDVGAAQPAQADAPGGDAVVAVVVSAPLSPETLARADETMVRVYRGFGVRVRVVEPGEEPLHDPGVVWRRLVIRASATTDFKAFGTTQIMGASPRGGETPGQTGYIFLDAIVRMAERHKVPVGALMGYVMAHELGHLLLPTGAHGPAGVMRATWSLSDLNAIREGSLSMQPSEGKLICEYLDSRRQSQ